MQVPYHSYCLWNKEFARKGGRQSKVLHMEEESAGVISVGSIPQTLEAARTHFAHVQPEGLLVSIYRDNTFPLCAGIASPGREILELFRPPIRPLNNHAVGMIAFSQTK